MSSVANDPILTIKRRWPDVYSALTAVPPTDATVSLSQPPSPTLIYNGIHLSSGYDKKREAQIQASLIPQEATEATIYGFATGELVEILIKRPSLKKLIVVITNLQLTNVILDFLPIADWLKAPRISLKCGSQENSLRTPFTAIPSCLSLAEPACDRIRDVVNLELATPYINLKHTERNRQLIETRFVENKKYIQNDGDVSELFKTRQKQTICISAAGPTLTETLNTLKTLHASCPIISLDASLQTLINHRVIPNYIITQDAHPTTTQGFLNVQCNNLHHSSLIYFPTVHNDALSQWPGKRFTAYSSSSLYQKLQQQQPKGTLFSSGSVIHPAVDLAVKMGAKNIIFFGADFGFPNDMSHAEGCIVRKKIPDIGRKITVQNGTGERIQTMTNLLGYLRDLELYISKHPEVSFYNTSKKGAYIKGCNFFESIAP